MAKGVIHTFFDECAEFDEEQYAESLPRDKCRSCGKDAPYMERGEWRLLRLTRPNCLSGGVVDEGVRLVCGNCLLPLRDAWAQQVREKS